MLPAEPNNIVAGRDEVRRPAQPRPAQSSQRGRAAGGVPRRDRRGAGSARGGQAAARDDGGGGRAICKDSRPTLAKVQLRHDALSARRNFVEDLRAKLALEPTGSRSTANRMEDFVRREKILRSIRNFCRKHFSSYSANADSTGARRRPARFSKSAATGETIEFSLREPKTKFDGATENWGRAAARASAARSLWSWPLSRAQYFRGAPWHIIRHNLIRPLRFCHTTVSLPARAICDRR